MITTGQWADALEPIARKNFDVGFEEVPAERDMFFKVRKGSKLVETYMELGDIPAMGQFTGTVNYADIAEGYKFTTTAIQYAQGIKIQRAFVETDQQDVVSGLPRKLGVSARRRIATDIFFPFNNAFNTSITTLDGLQLCSSAHTSNNGGSTQSNLGSTALSALAVESTRVRGGKFLSNTDGKIDVNLDTIVVPDDLWDVGYEIINSSGKVDTANNNVNFAKGRYNLIRSKWMGDSNNWFMVDSKLMKQYLEWSQIVELEFNNAQDLDSYVAKYSAYMFYSYAMKDWRFVFGHNVS